MKGTIISKIFFDVCMEIFHKLSNNNDICLLFISILECILPIFIFFINDITHKEVIDIQLEEACKFI